jgi:hypothetical protein
MAQVYSESREVDDPVPAVPSTRGARARVLMATIRKPSRTVWMMEHARNRLLSDARKLLDFAMRELDAEIRELRKPSGENVVRLR